MLPKNYLSSFAFLDTTRFLAAFLLPGALCGFGFVVRKVCTTFWNFGSLVGSSPIRITMARPEKAKPIDPALTSRLGQIVIRWTILENWISLTLATAINADLGGTSIITANAGVSTTIQWIRTILKIHVGQQPELQELIDLLERADDLRLERNALVHGAWDDTGCDPGTCMINTVGWNRSEIIRDCLITTTDLDDFLSHIDDWIADYAALGCKLGFPRRRGETKSIFAD